jgi:hypothetical protein
MAPGRAQATTVSGLEPSTQYHFAIRAQDEDLNQSAAFTTASASTRIPDRVAAGTYDDGHDAWSYIGTWTPWSGNGPRNRTEHYTGSPASAAELRFTGSRFTLTFTRHPNRGSIDVFVDGIKVSTINAYSSDLELRSTWTSPIFAAGDHSVRFVHSGGEGTYIDIDAIQIMDTSPAPDPVGAGIYDDADIHWVYSNGWTAWTGGGPLNDTEHYTDAVGSFAELQFTGASFTLTFTKHPNRGLIDVYVDGSKIHTIDAYSPVLAMQSTWSSPAFAAGDHTVRLVHAGSSGSYIDIDAIQILNAVEAAYDDADNRWTYSDGWTAWTGSGPTNDTEHYTGTVGSWAELAFDGSQFTLAFTRHPNRGLIDVYVDGNKIDSIDAYSPGLVMRSTWTSPILAAGAHTVRFVHAGSSGTYVDIDTITIQR